MTVPAGETLRAGGQGPPSRRVAIRASLGAPGSQLRNGRANLQAPTDSVNTKRSAKGAVTPWPWHTLCPHDEPTGKGRKKQESAERSLHTPWCGKPFENWSDGHSEVTCATPHSGPAQRPKPIRSQSTTNRPREPKTPAHVTMSAGRTRQARYLSDLAAFSLVSHTLPEHQPASPRHPVQRTPRSSQDTV